jgi:hypothetical protein
MLFYVPMRAGVQAAIAWPELKAAKVGVIEAQMQSSTKKSKWIALAVSISISVAIFLHAVIWDALGNGQYPVGPHTLATLKVVFYFMSAYSLITAWLGQFWRKTFLDRISRRRRLLPLTPEVTYLFLCYVSLVSPVFYGLVLHVCGVPLREYFYYAGASIAMTLAWGFSDLRKV